MMVLHVLMAICFVVFLIFAGVFIYGMIDEQRQKKNGAWFPYSRFIWIGLIGINVCNLIIQILNITKNHIK